MGYKVHVIARRSPGQPSAETVNGVQIHRVDGPFNATALGLCLSITRGRKDWVLHPHATSGIFMTLTHRIIPTPLVCHSHGTSRSHDVPIKLGGDEVVVNRRGSGMGFHMFRERSLWAASDRLLVVSNAVKEDVTKFYGIDPQKIRVIYNGVDAEQFSPLEDAPLPPQLTDLSSKRIILFVGHFGLRKGIFFAIRAMRQVRAAFPDAHLVCVGGTPAWLGRNEYRKVLTGEISRNGVEGCVTLLDAVKNTELVGFYRHSEVFVLPTYYEAFPKVVVEAMACGRPVVATRTGGIPELVDDGETGWLLPFGSPDAIADKLIMLLGDRGMRLSMGRLGREKVEKSFTWHAVAERTKSVYNELEPD